MVEDLAPLEKIYNFEGFCLGNVHILLDICCQHLGIYVNWGVSDNDDGNYKWTSAVRSNDEIAPPEASSFNTEFYLNVLILGSFHS